MVLSLTRKITGHCQSHSISAETKRKRKNDKTIFSVEVYLDDLIRPVAHRRKYILAGTSKTSSIQLQHPYGPAQLSTSSTDSAMGGGRGVVATNGAPLRRRKT